MSSTDIGLEEVQRRAAEWIDGLIPAGTDPVVFRNKLLQEMREFWLRPDDEGELVDVMIAALVYAHRSGINLAAQMSRKMDLNEHRTWVWSETEQAFRHV